MSKVERKSRCGNYLNKSQEIKLIYLVSDVLETKIDFILNVPFY